MENNKGAIKTILRCGNEVTSCINKNSFLLKLTPHMTTVHLWAWSNKSKTAHWSNKTDRS